ncbi:MAG TPA: peptidoglycan-binding domain-containing protein [Vicinamibacterales bacterium]|nr:peptidoglycan-binding domain-containing protein [Vicinamibacterales bacterium]
MRLQQRLGNVAMRRALAPVVQRQANTARLLNLESPRFKGDPVLEGVFDGFIELKKPRRGSAAVRKVQQALIDAGFPLPKFGADGDYGDETEAAVKDFQRAAGLENAEIDGIVGENTLSRLDARFSEGSAIVPERHCDLGFRNIAVDAVVFHGFTETPQSHLDNANRVLKPCCISFSLGTTITKSETETRAFFEGSTTYFTGGCETLSPHDSRIAADTAIGRLSKPFKVLFVERLENAQGRLRGTSWGPTCARLGSGPLRGFFAVAQGAGARTMPHEFAHYLMSVFAEHSVQTSNIQHIDTGATGTDVTPLQCDIMFTRALDESI